MNICVYCGSRPGVVPAYAQAARDLGQAIARQGHGLVYGGGNVGLMGIVADAVLAAGGPVVGVIPEALVQREVGHQGLSEQHVVPDMHVRKRMMAERADAFIALPGGIGTLEELFEVWTWRQLGYHDKPIGLLNVAGLLRRTCCASWTTRWPRASWMQPSAACRWSTTDPSGAAAPRAGRKLRWPRRRTTTAGSEAGPGDRLRSRLRRSRRCGCAPPARPR